MRRLAILLVLALAGTGAVGVVQAGAASNVSLLCLNKAGSRYKVKTAPTSCAHFGSGGAFGGGVNLEQLVWTGFGRSSATAKGIECGFHLPCSNIPVDVTASRIRKRCGDRVYTRLRATSSLGTTVVRVGHCAGPTF